MVPAYFGVYLLLSILLSAPMSHGLEVKNFTLKSDFPKGLDLNAYSSTKKLGSLASLKWYQLNGQWEKCVKSAEQNLTNETLGIWLPYTHLSCLYSWKMNDKSVKALKLMSSFKKLESHKSSLLLSSFEGHKEKLIELFLELAEVSLEKARSQFESFVERNHDLLDYMTIEQRSDYYRLLGEFAWLKQEKELASSNFLRSYRFSPSSQVLKRLQLLKVDNLLKNEKYLSIAIESEDEKKLWEKFQAAEKNGQTQNIAIYGQEFLNKHPGSGHVESVRDSINNVYKRLLYRRGEKYESAKNDFEKELIKAPPQDILYWATAAYERGYQDSSYFLAHKAADKWEGAAQAADALIIAGRSAFYLVKRSQAREHFETLIEKHSGHIASAEAQYFLGLIYYREGDFKKVINVYDKFLLSEASDKWELQVRYWLWRSLKKIDSPRIKELAESILKDFPLTYYGLLVRMDEKGGLQNLFAPEVKEVNSNIWWTKLRSERWERVKKLISLGWLDEAESEIDLMPDPQLAQGFIVRAKLWQSAGLNNRAIYDYAEAINIDHTYLSRNFLKEAFPQKFQPDVEAAEKEFSISKNLIWSIMRQESAFMPRAISPSMAYGLMQMLSPTAKETAKWLRVKNFNMPYDIFKSETSVRFGTHFLSRMSRKYKNIFPLAIASYNVGPGNLDRWLSHRSDLIEWEKFGTNPDDEMWMDELPWAETSFYVKAVLRNYLLYKIIHDEEDKLQSPPWAEAKISTDSKSS